MTIRNLCSSNQWIHSTAPLSKHHHFKAKPLVLCFVTSDTPTKRYLSAKCNVLNLQFILKTGHSLQYLHSRIKLVYTLNKFLVNDQLDAQFFPMILFQFSTYFEQPRAHHQESQLYQYRIWYVCRSESSFPTCTRNGHRHRVTYTRCCIDTISPDDEHEVARNM